MSVTLFLSERMSRTIAILAPSPVPFQIGGAEKFWLGLHQALSCYADAAVDIIKLPCAEATFSQVLHSYKAFSRLDLSHFDMVITTKYPAWMVAHPAHVLYLQHTLRGLYDTYHTTGLPERLEHVPPALKECMACLRKAQPTRDDLSVAFDLLERALTAKSLPSQLFAHPGPLLRETVHFFDRVALAPTQIAAYLAISGNVAQRRDYFPPDVAIKILHHPSDILEYTSTGQEYFFTASRLTPPKRVHLIVEAMRHVPGQTPLWIAGSGSELPYLRDLAADDPRIRFLGYVPDAELPGLYAGALAVPFTPLDEDYGLITIEAMHSGKPVITTHDAGGPCEFVTDGVSGYVTDPTPEALGAAMRRLAENPSLAATLGGTAKKRVAHITWPENIRALIDHTARCTVKAAAHGRQWVLVLSTFPPDKHGAGGQRRLYHVCHILAKRWPVLLLCYDSELRHGPICTELTSGIQEIRLAFGTAKKEALQIAATTGVSSGDIALMRMGQRDRELARLLADHGRNACCAVLEHPFLYPALHAHLPTLPFIYDAHNVEADLKAQFLPQDMAAEVQAVERDCAQQARTVLACSSDDAHRLTELYDLPENRCHRVPNGCGDALPLYAGAAEKRRLRRRLDYPEARLALFLGSPHKPNVDAVQHIMHMAPTLPEVQFLIAGLVSTLACVRDAVRPTNVHLLGPLTEDVKNILLRAADVGLNPMTSGAGTNLKVVEYLAAGLETVSTPFGLRGLEPDVAAYAHAASLEEFPSAIRGVLAAPLTAERGARLAEAARHVVHCLSWSSVLSPLPDLVTAVAGEAR